MNGLQLLDRFQLDDYDVVDEKIDTQTMIQYKPFVMNRKRMLSFKPDVAQFELLTQARLVDRLEQSRTQSAMHFECCVNNVCDEPLD